MSWLIQAATAGVYTQQNIREIVIVLLFEKINILFRGAELFSSPVDPLGYLFCIFLFKLAKIKLKLNWTLLLCTFFLSLLCLISCIIHHYITYSEPPTPRNIVHNKIVFWYLLRYSTLRESSANNMWNKPVKLSMGFILWSSTVFVCFANTRVINNKIILHLDFPVV